MDVLLFDAFETTFDLEPLRRELKSIGLDAPLELWFARTLRDGMALEIAGTFKSFEAVAEAALEALALTHGVVLKRDQVQSVMSQFQRLPVHADTARALEEVRRSGGRACLLTNGSAESADASLEAAGLANAVERVISIDEVSHWKPHRAAYLHAAAVLGVPASDLALVSVHGWDCHGARAAHLVSAWVSRKERRYSPLLAPPDIQAATVDEAAHRLLRLLTVSRDARPPAP